MPEIGAILSAIAVYFLAKEFFNRKIAILALFFAAVSSWHINLALTDSWIIWLPLLLTLVFLFLWRGLKGKHICNYFFSGLFLGLGLCVNPFFKFYSFIILVGLLTYWHAIKKDFNHIQYEHSRNFIFRGIILMTVTTLIIALPRIILDWPEWIGALKPISITDKAILSLPITILLIAGIFKSFIKLFKHWKTHRHFSTIQAILITWFFVGLFSWEAVATLPVIFIFAAEGCWWLFSWLKSWYSAHDKHPGEASLVATIVLIIFLISVGIAEFGQF